MNLILVFQIMAIVGGLEVFYVQQDGLNHTKKAQCHKAPDENMVAPSGISIAEMVKG
jgi:hypothetical protein